MWRLALTETIGNDGIWKEDEGFQTYPYSKELLMETKTSPWWCLEELPLDHMYDFKLEKVWHSVYI